MTEPLTLEGARKVGDPEADKVMSAFLEDHPGVRVREVVRSMAREMRNAPEDQHPIVADYFLDGPALPAWADKVQLARGQHFFKQHSLLIGAGLFCASLPEAYAGADGVEVLAITADLVSNTRRRIGETGQFLIDVMGTDPVGDDDADDDSDDDLVAGDDADDAKAGARVLVPGSRAYRSVRGVRLMHAAVRALVRDEKGPSWVREHGVPINQQDLVGTLLTFTSVVYRALDRLGIEYDSDGAEAHLHTWCVIGSLLGVDEDLLPWTRSRADEMGSLLREQLFAKSASGIVLASALLDELEASMPIGTKSVPRTLIRQLIGNETCDLLELPRSAWWQPVLGSVREVGETGGARGPSAVMARGLCKLLGRSLFMDYIDRGTRGDRPPFVIPDDLAASMRVHREARLRRPRRSRRAAPVST